jgi:preprotein translocase subunit SecG
MIEFMLMIIILVLEFVVIGLLLLVNDKKGGESK